MNGTVLRLLTEGFTLGLAVGISCLATCTPVYAPLLAVKERGWAAGLVTVVTLSAGRFIAYAAFGLAVGGAGAMISDQAIAKHDLIIASYAALSGYLLFTALVQAKRERSACAFQKLAKYSGNPFIVGVLTGFSICPAFLLAIARSLDAGGAVGGLMLFMGFFTSTTMYLLPIAAISFLSRMKLFRAIGIGASVAVAGWYLCLAARTMYYLIRS